MRKRPSQLGLTNSQGVTVDHTAYIGTFLETMFPEGDLLPVETLITLPQIHIPDEYMSECKNGINKGDYSCLFMMYISTCIDSFSLQAKT